MGLKDRRPPRSAVVHTVNRIPPEYDGNVFVSHGDVIDPDEGDDHTQYQLRSEKSQADGYASLDDDTKVPLVELPTGTTVDTVALGEHTHDLADITDDGDLAAIDLSGNADDVLHGDGTWSPDLSSGHGWKIQTFSVADDSRSLFGLIHAPIAGSYNVTVNGLGLEDTVDYTITGSVLTIVDPTDVFLGADTQGSPWTLRIQYDYDSSTPVASADPENTTGIEADNVATATFPTPPTAGTSVIVGVRAGFSDSAVVTGLGATWTKILELNGTGGSTRPTAIWLGEGVNGVDDEITATESGSHLWIAGIALDGALTASGAQTSTATNATNGSSIVASQAGIAVTLLGRNAGTGTVTHTPTTGWTTKRVDFGANVGAIDLAIRTVAAGETIQAHSNLTIDQLLAAVLGQA